MNRHPSAFTLLELVLVIAILVVILAFSAPIAWSFVARNDLDVSVGVAAQELRRAQALAAANVGGSGWGVEFESQEVILFRGANFAGRNAAYDEDFGLPSALNIIGPPPDGRAGPEVDFAAETGQPAAPAIITFSDGLSQSATVEINGIGMVSY